MKKYCVAFFFYDQESVPSEKNTLGDLGGVYIINAEVSLEKLGRMK